MKRSYVYILMNKYKTTFYIGVTSNLRTRMTEHLEGKGSIFTKKYNLKDLVFYEEFSDINQAISREKPLKNWHRAWKLDLIKEKNPTLSTLQFM